MMRHLAKANAEEKAAEYKEYYDRKTAEHKFKVNDKVWYSETNFLNKNEKLAKKWIGPAILLEVMETTARIKTPAGIVRLINVNRLKPFFEESQKAEKNRGNPDEFHYQWQKDVPKELSARQQKIRAEGHRPLTRALAKLIKANEAETAIDLIMSLDDAATTEELINYENFN